MQDAILVRDRLLKELAEERDRAASRRYPDDGIERAWRGYEAMMLAPRSSGGAGGKAAVQVVEAVEAHLPDEVKPGTSDNAAINSRQLVRRNPSRWLLSEGYAVTTEGWARSHSWVTERESGRVVDRTWPHAMIPSSYCGPVAYLGYRFHPDFTLSHAFSNVRADAGVIASEGSREWAAIRRGFVLDEEGLVVGYA